MYAYWIVASLEKIVKKSQAPLLRQPSWTDRLMKNYGTEIKQNILIRYFAPAQHVQMEDSKMESFAKLLEEKLKTLEPSQTSIQTLSLWIIHHHAESENIRSTWVECVKKGWTFLFVYFVSEYIFFLSYQLPFLTSNKVDDEMHFL